MALSAAPAAQCGYCSPGAAAPSRLHKGPGSREDRLHLRPPGNGGEAVLLMAVPLLHAAMAWSFLSGDFTATPIIIINITSQ